MSDIEPQIETEITEKAMHMMEEVTKSSEASAFQTPVAKRPREEIEPDTPPPLTEERFTQVLQESVRGLHARFSEVQEDIQVNSNAIENGCSEFRQDISRLTAENKSLVRRVERLETENSEMMQRLIEIEAQSRRINLRFHGLPETFGEDPESKVVQYLEYNGFPHLPRAIERAHLLGPKLDCQHRPIIVRFSHFKDRERVWKKLGHGLFPPPFNSRHVREDFPKEREHDRGKLLTIAKAAINAPVPDTQQKPRVNLSSDKLYINNNRYTIKSLSTLPEYLQPQNIYTPMTQDKAAFYTASSPLSNHFIASFEHEGTTFNCGEQFIMAKKAQSCNDHESEKAIMNETSPAKQKQIGKSLKNFNQAQWQDSATEILTPGLLAKFEQCSQCKDMLLKTDNRTIFEASPHDKYWGIGMSLFSKDIWNVESHTGSNVMGKILMQIRSKLNETHS